MASDFVAKHIDIYRQCVYLLDLAHQKARCVLRDLHRALFQKPFDADICTDLPCLPCDVATLKLCEKGDWETWTFMEVLGTLSGIQWPDPKNPTSEICASLHAQKQLSLVSVELVECYSSLDPIRDEEDLEKLKARLIELCLRAGVHQEQVEFVSQLTDMYPCPPEKLEDEEIRSKLEEANRLLVEGEDQASPAYDIYSSLIHPNASVDVLFHAYVGSSTCLCQMAQDTGLSEATRLLYGRSSRMMAREALLFYPADTEALHCFGKALELQKHQEANHFQERAALLNSRVPRSARLNSSLQLARPEKFREFFAKYRQAPSFADSSVAVYLPSPLEGPFNQLHLPDHPPHFFSPSPLQIQADVAASSQSLTSSRVPTICCISGFVLTFPNLDSALGYPRATFKIILPDWEHELRIEIPLLQDAAPILDRFVPGYFVILRGWEQTSRGDCRVFEDFASSTPTCWCCGAQKPLLICPSCLLAVYCGKECSTEDWPVHKAFCEAIKGRRGTVHPAPPGQGSTFTLSSPLVVPITPPRSRAFLESFIQANVGVFALFYALLPANYNQHHVFKVSNSATAANSLIVSLLYKHSWVNEALHVMAHNKQSEEERERHISEISRMISQPETVCFFFSFPFGPLWTVLALDQLPAKLRQQIAELTTVLRNRSSNEVARAIPAAIATAAACQGEIIRNWGEISVQQTVQLSSALFGQMAAPPTPFQNSGVAAVAWKTPTKFWKKDSALQIIRTMAEEADFYPENIGKCLAAFDTATPTQEDLAKLPLPDNASEIWYLISLTSKDGSNEPAGFCACEVYDSIPDTADWKWARRLDGVSSLEPSLIHIFYVFVEPQFRNLGLANLMTRLLEACPNPYILLTLETSDAGPFSAIEYWKTQGYQMRDEDERGVVTLWKWKQRHG